MSAVSKINVFDKLLPFDCAEAASLHELDVFHQNFSRTEDLPPARNLNKTYEQGLEEGRELAHQEGALRLQEIDILVSVLSQNLTSLGRDIEASHSRAISNILRAVLPNLAKQTASSEISQFISDISGQALDGFVELTVNSNFKPHLAVIADKLAQSGVGMPEFSIHVDDNLVGLAVSAKWRSGGGRIDIDGAVTNCLALLEGEK